MCGKCHTHSRTTTAFACIFQCFFCQRVQQSCNSSSASPELSEEPPAEMVKMTKSKTFQAYLPNCHRTYSCIHCRAHLANHDELISKASGLFRDLMNYFSTKMVIIASLLPVDKGCKSNAYFKASFLGSFLGHRHCIIRTRYILKTIKCGIKTDLIVPMFANSIYCLVGIICEIPYLKIC